MPDRVNLVLPWPPTTNHYYTVARKRKVTSAEGRRFQEAAAAMLKGCRTGPPLEGPLEMSMCFHPPEMLVSRNTGRRQKWGKRRWDLTNRLKPAEDALTKARIIVDDQQVERCHLHKGAPDGDGYIEVRLVKL